MPPNEEGAGVDDQAKRLYLARWLTRRAADVTAGAVVPHASHDDLAALARRLEESVSNELPIAGLAFQPSYPGPSVDDPVSARLMLICSAAVGEVPLGVVYTVLIAGRPPEVSVAPPVA